MADVVDAEVSRIVEEPAKATRAVLEAHRERLEAIGAKLLEKEFLDGDEFRALLAAG